MDRHIKAFVVASLTYLVAAAALGIWMGGGDAPEWAWFGHVHFNLLGFMAMMIYGIGYFIIPRFNGRTLKWPGWVVVHLYAANAGLIGMVVTYPWRPSPVFLLFALLSVASAAMFAVNLCVTILETLPVETEAVGGSVPSPEPDPGIRPDMRIGEIISRWPQTVDIFVRNGFAPLADPAHREKVKQLPVTLAMGCTNHGVDLEALTTLLTEAVAGEKEAGASSAAPAEKAAAVEGRLAAGESIGPQHIIGEILKVYPSTEKVFRKYYGAACFSCPGQATESVRQSALMHNVEEDELLHELNLSSQVE